MSRECEDHRSRFSEYLDGVLGEPERAALESHLARCAECGRELEGWRRTVRALAGLPQRSAPTGFAARVLRRLAAEERRGSRAVAFVLWTRVLPVAALLLIVLALTLTVEHYGASRRQPEAVRLAMAPSGMGREGEADLAGGGGALESPRPQAAATGLSLTEAVSPKPLAAPPQPAPAAGRAGAVAAAGAPRDRRAEGGGEAERETRPPALSWGVPEREAVREPAAEEAASKEGLDLRMLAELPPSAPAAPSEERALTATGLPAAPSREEPLLFGQLVDGAAAAQPQGGPPEQVLTLVGSDQSGLARQAVAVANTCGVPAVLSLAADKEGGAMEVRLSVPVARYDALLTGLAALTPPESQTLSNTAAARGAFLGRALENYRAHRAAAGQVAEALKDELAGGYGTGAGAPDVGRSAGLLRARAAGPAGGVSGSVAAGAATDMGKAVEAPPGPVNLVVRIVAPAAARRE
jgi:anti-sigma factor RsiW